jgi:adenosine deaminase
MALTSNIQTGCVGDPRGHPFAGLLRDGLSVGLNTDNRTISGTTLSREYARAADALGLSRADLARATEHAAEASFLPEHDKRQLVQRIQHAWREHAA